MGRRAGRTQRKFVPASGSSRRRQSRPLAPPFFFFFHGSRPTHPAGYLTEHHFDDPYGNSGRCDDVLCTLLALNRVAIKRIRPPNSKLENESQTIRELFHLSQPNFNRNDRPLAPARLRGGIVGCLPVFLGRTSTAFPPTARCSPEVQQFSSRTIGEIAALRS